MVLTCSRLGYDIQISISLSCQVLLFVVVSFVVNGLVLITVSLFTIRKIWVSLSYHEICTVVMKFFGFFHVRKVLS